MPLRTLELFRSEKFQQSFMLHHSSTMLRLVLPSRIASLLVIQEIHSPRSLVVKNVYLLVTRDGVSKVPSFLLVSSISPQLTAVEYF